MITTDDPIPPKQPDWSAAILAEQEARARADSDMATEILRMQHKPAAYRTALALKNECGMFSRYVDVFNRSTALITKLVCARRMARCCSKAREIVEELGAKRPDLKLQEEQARSEFRAIMLIIGQWLTDPETRHSVDQQLGFDGLCDLIGANPVHRADARDLFEKGEIDALGAAIFVSGLEDSANANSGKQPLEWNDGPLFHAYMQVFHKALLDNPGAFPNPFDPGQPFYGTPVRVMRADGTVYTKRPALVVHDRDGGTRVFERKPERIKP